MSDKKEYLGWRYDFDARRPATGLWRAERFGVGMGAGTEEALRRMIEFKAHQAQRARDQAAR